MRLYHPNVSNSNLLSCCPCKTSRQSVVVDAKINWVFVQIVSYPHLLHSLLVGYFFGFVDVPCIGILEIDAVYFRNNNLQLPFVQMWIERCFYIYRFYRLCPCFHLSIFLNIVGIIQLVPYFIPLMKLKKFSSILILLAFSNTGCVRKSTERTWLDLQAPCRGKLYILPMLLLSFLVWSLSR